MRKGSLFLIAVVFHNPQIKEFGKCPKQRTV